MTRIPETDAEFNTFTITATLRLGAASEGGSGEVIVCARQNYATMAEKS